MNTADRFAVRVYTTKKTKSEDLVFSGRGTKTRTQDTWFWRPLLYQLSYTPM